MASLIFIISLFTIGYCVKFEPQELLTTGLIFEVDVNNDGTTYITVTAPNNKWNGIGFGTQIMSSWTNAVIYTGDTSTLTDWLLSDNGNLGTKMGNYWTASSISTVGTTVTYTMSRANSISNICSYCIHFNPSSTTFNVIMALGRGTDTSIKHEFKSPYILQQAATAEPTTSMPTTAEPTTSMPTTAEPTTSMPTTMIPTSAKPTTASPSTPMPVTAAPTSTATPTTSSPSTDEPTTDTPTTMIPTTNEPTTSKPTEIGETTPMPVTAAPTSTATPTTASPSKAAPTTTYETCAAISLITDVSITVGRKTSDQTMQITITGPTDKWFAFGFGTTIMKDSYAIVTGGDPQVSTERTLAAQGVGSTVGSSGTRTVTIGSSTTTVTLVRPYAYSGTYDFTAFMECKVDTIDLISAIGSGLTIQHHATKGIGSLTRTCSCESATDGPTTMIPTTANRIPESRVADPGAANSIFNAFYIALILCFSLYFIA